MKDGLIELNVTNLNLYTIHTNLTFWWLNRITNQSLWLTCLFYLFRWCWIKLLPEFSDKFFINWLIWIKRPIEMVLKAWPDLAEFYYFLNWLSCQYDSTYLFFRLIRLELRFKMIKWLKTAWSEWFYCI